MAIEFLRLGSSIPGAYWGNCCACLIQNFKTDPDSPCSIQLVDGDGGNPLSHSKGGFKFAGKTEKEIFLQRLRYGTFSDRDMPNHVFIACLTQSQISYGVGAKWLKILKEQGFEFFFASDNSVYSGATVISKGGQGMGVHGSHPNYYFILRRNIGTGAATDPFKAPKEWDALPNPYEGCKTEAEHQDVQIRLYNDLPKGVFYTEKELEDAGVPITYAGIRSTKPQQSKAARESVIQSEQKTKNPAKAAPFAA